MNQKHTPGRWKARKTINAKTPFEIYATSEHTTIALVTSLTKYGVPADNAKLIAAAPEMLEALILAAKELEQSLIKPSTERLIREIIKKATS